MKTQPLADPMAFDPREAKLPSWARNTIGSLRRRVQVAERTAETARLATDPDGSNTVLDLYTIVRKPVGLGNDAQISFRTAAGPVFTVELRDDVLSVMTDRGRIGILPEASNAVRIKSGV